MGCPSKLTDPRLITLLAQLVADEYCWLDGGGATGCRCLGCWSYKIKRHDDDDNETIVAEDEDLRQVIYKAAAKLFGEQEGFQ